MEHKAKKILLVLDGNAIVHRAWHALPPLATKKGMVISGVYGFVTILLSAIRQQKPTHIAATFDLAGPTFRHTMFDAYKAQREKKPDELYAQIPLIQKVLATMHIPVFTAKGFEADDVIGTIATQAVVESKDIEVIIATGDLDTLQLVNDQVKVLTLRKGMSDTVLYDRAAVVDRYTLTPEQLVDYKALRGDPSDNIPGVKGIGEKTATELITNFGSIEAIYEALENGDARVVALKPAVREKLLVSRKEAFLAKDLSRIRTDVAVGFRLVDCEFQAPVREDVREVFEQFEFTKLLQQIPARTHQESLLGTGGDISALKATPEHKFVVINDPHEARRVIDRLSNAETIAFRSVADVESIIHPSICFLCVHDGVQTVIFGKEALGKTKKELQHLFSLPIKKICHDLKKELHHFAQLALSLEGDCFDLMIASYLCNPGERRHSLDAILAYYRRFSLPESVEKANEPARLAAELGAFVGLRDELLVLLEKEKMMPVFSDIDMPLCRVLATMERAGVAIDKKYFQELAHEMQKDIDALVKKIYAAAGVSFNVNSPQQMQKVLFDDLALSPTGVKKTAKNKTISTAASELEKLRGVHPIIALILDYREISKVHSTYVTPLPALVDTLTGRIHSTFQQTVTATGRLSSVDPNLQNIPTPDTVYGKKVRNGFVAPHGRVLVACDYSQFELRIVAHMVQEQIMIDAFTNGEDIHRRTAVHMWGETHADEKRRIAKTINFGILYGMGPHRLAESANISVIEAREFIDQYFALHPHIAQYVDQMENRVKKDGYVETMFGRRRYFRNFHLMNQREQAESLRQAVNMPIQGIQADMLKLAMIRVHSAIEKKYGFEEDAKVKMLLQIHDELIFEMENDVVDEAVGELVPLMEGVTKLSVPLVVNISYGKKWGELKKR